MELSVFFITQYQKLGEIHDVEGIDSGAVCRTRVVYRRVGPPMTLAESFW